MLAVFAPIWILAALGYVARRTGLLDATAAQTLSKLVFHLAIPATLFLALSTQPLSAFTGRPLIAFGTSTVVVIGTGWLVAGRWLDRKPGEQAIWGMSAGYVNSANLGIPIARLVLGSTAFLVQVVLLQVLVVTPVILTALDRDADGGVRLRRLATMPLRNPVIAASALGVLASVTGYRPPPVVHASLSLLADAAVPVALIALGAALHSETPESSVALPELAAIGVLKLAAQPAVAFAVGALALHLDHPQLLAVTVCAGLPTAQNTFIFAQQYGVGEAQASRAVLVTTTASLGTLAVIAWALSR